MKRLQVSRAHFFPILLWIMTLFLWATPLRAAGDKEKDVDICQNGDQAEERIAACSRVIDDRSQSVEDRGNSFASRGLDYKDKKDYDRAIADLNEAIRLQPEDADFYAYRAKVYEIKGDPDRAIADYDGAARFEPERPSIYIGRAGSYQAKGDSECAIADYGEAIRIDPLNAESHYERARYEQTTGDYDQAIRDLTSAIEIDANDPEYRNSRGMAHRMKGKNDEAITDFSDAIRLDKTYWAAYLNRAEVHEANGNYEQAVADIGEAIKVDEKSADLFYRRGNVHRASGDNERAIADYGEAIRLDSKAAGTYYARAISYFDTGKLNEAIADLGEAIRLAPDDESPHMLLGMAYGANGDDEHAIGEYGEAIRINPKSASHLNVRAWAYFKGEKLDLALADANAAINLDPAFASAYATRAFIDEKLNKKDDAIADFQKALSLAPAMPEAVEGLTRLGGPPPPGQAVESTPSEPEAQGPPPDSTPAAASRATPSTSDQLKRLARFLEEAPSSEALYPKGESVELRAGPASSFEVTGYLKEGQNLTALAKLKYKSGAACGVDGKSAGLAWFRVRLPSGQEAFLPEDNVGGPPTSEKPRATVGGTYEVHGTNRNGSNYRGTAVVVVDGESVQMNWAIGEERFHGTGTLKGSRMVVDWGQKTPVIYDVGQDGVLNGTWDDGQASETLTPSGAEASLHENDAAAPTTSGKSRPAVGGTYDVHGTNRNGSSYRGTCVVVVDGASVKMSWAIGKDRFKGSGTLNGSRMVVDWGQKYPVIYDVGKGGVLNGTWDNGRASETLTPRR